MSTGPRTAAGIERIKAARAKLAARLLAAGLPLYGGRPRGIPGTYEGLMAKSLAIVAEVEAAPGSALARELDDLTGKSIDVVRDVLTRKVARKAYTTTVNGKQVRVLPDMRLLAIQTQTATDIIKAKIRVDETAFKARRADQLMPIMEALLGTKLGEPEE